MINPSNSLLKERLLEFIRKTRNLNEATICEVCKKTIKKHSDEELIKCFLVSFPKLKSLEKINKLLEECDSLESDF